MRLPSGTITSVLLIDDDPDDFDLVTEAMSNIDPGVRVDFCCADKEITQDYIKSFDLVLLDINMPGRDGFFWLKFLRKNGFGDRPIVMYTNSLSPKNIAKAYTEGANLYFHKPVTFPSLEKALSKLINLDWSRPDRITQQYQNHGAYLTFQA